MKNLLLMIGLSTLLFSCGKNNPGPGDQTCKLTFYKQARTLPSADETTNTTTFYEDSIVNITGFNGSPESRETYTFDEANNKINVQVIQLSTGNLVAYGTYYLNGSGLIDSFVRTEVDGLIEYVGYRNTIYRNSSNRIVREIISYISYGYDNRYFYDDNGDYAYGLEKGLGTQTFDDTVIYTLDLTKPDNGSPLYLMENLKGKRSAHHVIRKQMLDRTSYVVRREQRWTFSDLNAEGNATFIKYETENYPGGVFIADYAYDRTYEYSCP